MCAPGRPLTLSQLKMIPESWTIVFREKHCWAAKMKSTNEKSATILPGVCKLIELVFKDRDSFKFCLISCARACHAKAAKAGTQSASLREALRQARCKIYYSTLCFCALCALLCGFCVSLHFYTTPDHQESVM